MILYFIRHGQTDWNKEGKVQGSNDIGLNHAGILQAKELGQKVSEENIHFSKIYTSRQIRAQKTAQILSRATNTAYIPIDGLEELNLGDWEGLLWEDIERSYPAEYAAWINNRRYERPPKGESYQEMLDRALAAVYRIINENTDNVAIVTHSAVIMCLQAYITDTPFNEMIKFRVGNSTIQAIDSEAFIKRELS